MTDASKYTGAHKARFDAETGDGSQHALISKNVSVVNRREGQGKGIEGRKDLDKNTGYVGAYNGDGTYDKTH